MNHLFQSLNTVQEDLLQRKFRKENENHRFVANHAVCKNVIRDAATGGSNGQKVDMAT